jgi:hypothetical protein
MCNYDERVLNNEQKTAGRVTDTGHVSRDTVYLLCPWVPAIWRNALLYI